METEATTTSGRSRTTSAYAMPPSMVDAIKEAAAARGVSASKLVRDAVDHYLVELAVEEGAAGEQVELPGGGVRPLVELHPVMISGTSSLNRDNPCYGSAEVVFWRALSPRMMGALMPRFARLVAALHVEDRQRRNGGQL